MSFLNKHKVIQKNQFGFQSNVSTNHALVEVVSNCFDNINDNLYADLIFLDLTKAFDTVNHEILLHKLDHYGIRGQANNLLRAFLKRRQYVLTDDNVSPLLCHNIGVTQGSILGLLLFLLHINDLPFSMSCKPRLFADDTCLVCSNANLASKMNDSLHRVYLWLKANQLMVNLSKSHALSIPPNFNKPLPLIDLTINNFSIFVTHSVKYLGVTTDFNLKFESHISSTV